MSKLYITLVSKLDITLLSKLDITLVSKLDTTLVQYGKFRVTSNIHFILAGLASNSCKASRNLKTLATITGLQL